MLSWLISSGPKILLKCPISPWYLKIGRVYLGRNVFIHLESSNVFLTTCPNFVFYYSKNIFKFSKKIFICIISISLVKLFIIPSSVIQLPPSSLKYCHVFLFYSFFLEEFSFVWHFTDVMFCHLSWQFLPLFFHADFIDIFPFLLSFISLPCMFISYCFFRAFGSCFIKVNPHFTLTRIIKIHK